MPRGKSRFHIQKCRGLQKAAVPERSARNMQGSSCRTQPSRFATKLLAAACVLNAVGLVALAESASSANETHTIREPLGLSLTSDWLSPWQHFDFSPTGVPFVHPLTLEPPYMDRSLILDV